MTTPVDRNLALELVRVTEAAALQSARFVGMGDKEAAQRRDELTPSQPAEVHARPSL